MEMINKLTFRLFDPVKAGEEWAVSDNYPYKVVGISIDGRELLDIIREIEYPYLKEEDSLILDGDYGHLPPDRLYEDLREAAQPGTYYYKRGAELFCCGSCGEPGCWSVTCKVREECGVVLWYGFRHNHRDWDYNLTFRFEKSAYEKAMRILQHMAMNN